jgi:hypothetical protein
VNFDPVALSVKSISSHPFPIWQLAWWSVKSSWRVDWLARANSHTFFTQSPNVVNEWFGIEITEIMLKSHSRAAIYVLNIAKEILRSVLSESFKWVEMSSVMSFPWVFALFECFFGFDTSTLHNRISGLLK